MLNYENANDFFYKRKSSRATTKSTLFIGIQRWTLVSPWRMHCLYSIGPKQCQPVKKLSPPVIKLCLSKGISQLFCTKFCLRILYQLVECLYVNLKVYLGLIWLTKSMLPHSHDRKWGFADFFMSHVQTLVPHTITVTIVQYDAFPNSYNSLIASLQIKNLEG